MLEKQIIEIINENKEFWTTLAGLLGSSVVWYLDKKLKAKKEKIHEKRVEADKVAGIAHGLEHPFFMAMDKYLAFDIKNIEIDDPLKREVTIKFLMLKFGVFNSLLKALVKENASIDKFYEAISVGVKEYEDKARDMGIPELFVQKFSRVHSLVITSIYDNIGNVLKNDSVENKLIVVLHIYKMAFDLTYLWAEDIVDTMNGELHRALCKRCENPGAICGKGCTR